MSLVVGTGKDGVLYVLDKDNTKFGQGSDYSVLKQQPIFFTYFPGFGIDASNVHALDQLYDGKTHHLHGSPVFWNTPVRGPMLFVWGENECLRAWTIAASGTTQFVAKSHEVASAGAGGKGGMPGGMLTLSSNGTSAGTGIVWSLTPISGDANRHVVEGILRAYDAETLDPVANTDGTPRLKLLWDSKHIPGNTFNHCKFCPPVVADGKIFVPTYDGRVDVYGLRAIHAGPRPTNLTRVPRK
jgi:outer membrane protein assembly factor BamB